MCFLNKTTLAISLSLLLAGCGQPQQTETASDSQTSSVKQTSQTEELQEIYKNYFDEQLKLNPLLATYIGDNQYNDELPNFYSEEHLEELLALEKNYLEKIKGIGTFLKTPDGFKVTAPEGFVAIDSKGGAVKLVDRLTFSHANFTIAKDW